jgi:hypothetical protein
MSANEEEGPLRGPPSEQGACGNGRAGRTRGGQFLKASGE